MLKEIDKILVANVDLNPVAKRKLEKIYAVERFIEEKVPEAKKAEYLSALEEYIREQELKSTVLWSYVEEEKISTAEYDRLREDIGYIDDVPFFNELPEEQRDSFWQDTVAGNYLRKIGLCLATVGITTMIAGLPSLVPTAFAQEIIEDNSLRTKIEFRNNMYDSYYKALSGEGIGEKDLKELQEFSWKNANILGSLPTSDLEAFQTIIKTFWDSYTLMDKTATDYGRIYSLYPYLHEKHKPSLAPVLNNIKELRNTAERQENCLRMKSQTCYENAVLDEKNEFKKLNNNLDSINDVIKDLEKMDIPTYHRILPIKVDDKVDIKIHTPSFTQIKVKAENDRLCILPPSYDIDVKYTGDEVGLIEKDKVALRGPGMWGKTDIEYVDGVKTNEYSTNRVIKESSDTIKFISKGGGFSFADVWDGEGKNFRDMWLKFFTEKLDGDFLISVKYNSRGIPWWEDGLTTIDVNFGKNANEEVINYLYELSEELNSFLKTASYQIGELYEEKEITKPIYPKAEAPSEEVKTAPLEKASIPQIPFPGTYYPGIIDVTNFFGGIFGSVGEAISSIGVTEEAPAYERFYGKNVEDIREEFKNKKFEYGGGTFKLEDFLDDDEATIVLPAASFTLASVVNRDDVASFDARKGYKMDYNEKTIEVNYDLLLIDDSGDGNVDHYQFEVTRHGGISRGGGLYVSPKVVGFYDVNLVKGIDKTYLWPENIGVKLTREDIGYTYIPGP